MCFKASIRFYRFKIMYAFLDPHWTSGGMEGGRGREREGVGEGGRSELK